MTRVFELYMYFYTVNTNTVKYRKITNTVTHTFEKSTVEMKCEKIEKGHILVQGHLGVGCHRFRFHI